MIRPVPYSKYAIGLFLIVALYCIFNVSYWKKENQIIKWDVISYYSYLPATFIYKDITLSFTDSYTGEHKFIFWPKKSPSGNNVIMTSMGMSYLYAPFFFMGHIFAHWLGYDAGGYSEPYKFFLHIGTLIYLLIGLIYFRKFMLSIVDNEWIVAIVIVVLFAGTNLFWYSVFEPGMPHAYNFALIAIFLFLTDKWHQKPDIKKSIFIGFLIGLISLIRPTNLLIALLFIFWDVISVEGLLRKIQDYYTKWRLLLLIVIAAFIIWIPQLLYWKMQTGQWLYYSYGSDEKFFFLTPQIINGLFSYRSGWLLYAPVMAFALFGFVPLFYDKSKNKFYAFLIFILIYIYVTLSWWSWWYGGSFGLRAFVDVYTVLAVPLAVLIKWIIAQKLLLRIVFIVLVISSTLLGAFHTVQYYYSAIHWDSMSKASYWDSFGRIRPSPRFYDLLEHPDYEKARKGNPNAIIDPSTQSPHGN